MNKEQILFDSEKAAKFVTGISGWVDSHGRFFGNDEHAARFSGSTHKHCECGEVIETRGYCSKCHERKQAEKYNRMPRQRWDGETPLYSQMTDEYFFDEDALRDYIKEACISLADLRLIICTPNKLSEIEADYWIDDLPEDGDLPADVEEALDALNEAIRKAGPISWSPGRYAAECDL